MAEKLVKGLEAVKTLTEICQEEIDQLESNVEKWDGKPAPWVSLWKKRVEFLQDFRVRLREVVFPHTTKYGREIYE